ncbi:hypothetical protein ACFS07_20160 [Undibacterium arcticum]
MKQDSALTESKKRLLAHIASHGMVAGWRKRQSDRSGAPLEACGA